jgi:hypothetical protein
VDVGVAVGDGGLGVVVEEAVGSGVLETSTGSCVGTAGRSVSTICAVSSGLGFVIVSCPEQATAVAIKITLQSR